MSAAPPAVRSKARASRLLVAIAAAALAAPPEALAAEDRCGVADPSAPGGFRPRMGLLRVTAEDADGRPLEGVVEVDGVRLGPTGKALAAPVCARQVRVVAGGRVWEQALEASADGLTSVRARLGPAGSSTGQASPPRAAAGKAAPAAAGGDAGAKQVPAGMACVHYHRPDGDYARWGLHTWESFDDGAPDRPVAGVGWDHPLKPTGRDAFGLYWLLPVRDYRNGAVNFIVHAGAEREHCGQDERLLLSTGREAWVVTGVCEALHSRAEAQRAAQQAR